MKPQLRPFSAITSETIWDSSKYWILLTTPTPRIIWSQWRLLGSIRASLYARKQSFQVYPCDYDHSTGEITPIPWVLMEGEEEIEEWFGFDCEHKAVCDFSDDSKDAVKVWSLQYQTTRGAWFDIDQDITLPVRNGLRPSPRQGSRWVWEATR